MIWFHYSANKREDRRGYSGLIDLYSKDLKKIHAVSQFGGAGFMPQFLKRLGLYLSDSFPGQIKNETHFLEGSG
jgi:hypothetical protein